MPAEMKLEDLFRDDSETCPFVGFSNEETEKVKKNSAAKILDLQQQLAIENGVVKQEEIDVPVEEELFSYPVDGIKTELSATFGGIKEEQIECRISSFTLIKSEPTDYISPSYCNSLHDIKPNGLVIPKEEPMEKGGFRIPQNVCSDSVDGAKTKRTIKPKLSGNEFVSAADDIIQKMVSKTQQAPILIVPIKRLPEKVTQNTINVRTLDDCVDLVAPANKSINSKTAEVISSYTALDESNFDELPDVSVPFEMSVESYGIHDSSHLSASSKTREISQDNQKQNSSSFPIRTPCSVFHECSIPTNEIPSPNPRSITLPLLPKDFVFHSVVEKPSERAKATPSSGEPAVADDVVLFFDALIDSAYTFCPEEFSLPGNIIRIKGYKQNESYSCESSEELHSKRPKRKYTRRAGHNEEFVPPHKKRRARPPARPSKGPREDYDTAMPPPLSIITRTKGRKSKIDSAPDSNTILNAIENVVKSRKSKIDSAPDSNTILNAIENVVKNRKSKIDSAPDSKTILNAIENVVKTSCVDHANVTKKKGRSTHVNESLPVVDDSQSSSENIAGPPVSSNLWLQYSSHLYQDESKRTKQKKMQIRKVQTFMDKKEKTGNSELPKKKKQDFNSSVDVFMLERELNRDQQRLSLMKVEYEAQRSSIERLRKSLIKETKLLIEKEKIKQQNRKFEKVCSTASHSEDMLNFDSLSEDEDFMNFSSNLSVTNLLSSPGKESLAFGEFTEDAEFSDFDASSLLSPFDSLDSEKHKFPFLGASISNSRIPNNGVQLSSGYPRTNHSPFLNSAEASDKIRNSKSPLNSKPINGKVQNRRSNSFPSPSSRMTPATSSESRNSTATRLAESLCEALKTKDSLNAAKKFHHQKKSHANHHNEINLPNASRPAILNSDAFKKPLSPLNSLLNKYRKRFYCY